jgi:hypothetical protein
VTRRPQRRDTALAVLRAHHKAHKILDQDLPTFEMLFRRCRTSEETAQVMAALHHYMEDIRTATDRYAVLMRDKDFFEPDGQDISS